jgi:hypothetical protein
LRNDREKPITGPTLSLLNKKYNFIEKEKTKQSKSTLFLNKIIFFVEKRKRTTD